MQTVLSMIFMLMICCTCLLCVSAMSRIKCRRRIGDEDIARELQDVENESDEVNEYCTTRILNPSSSRYDTDQSEAVLSKKDSYFAIFRNRFDSRRTRILFIVNAMILLIIVSGIIVLFVLNTNKGKELKT